MIHSVLSPSASGKWGSKHGCTGYVKMALLHPGQLTENIEAKEGTAAHEIGCSLIDLMRVGNLPSFKLFDGKLASNGIPFDEDMYYSALLYANDVVKVMRSTGVFGSDSLGLERKIDIDAIHPQCYGFVDCWINHGHRDHLYIWDFKYGRRHVDVYECLQLLCYLCGIRDYYHLDDLKVTVHLRIIQPRSYHTDGPVQEWVINLAELRGYFNQLEEKAHEALSSHSQLRTGPHCRDCCALLSCPAALESGVSLYETAMETKSVKLTNTELAIHYSIVTRALKQLGNIQASMSEQMTHMLQKGNVLPGYQLEPGRGSHKWSKPASEIATLGDTVGHKLRKEVSVITPNQALAAGVPDHVVNAVSEKKLGSLKLKPISESKLRRLFK